MMITIANPSQQLDPHIWNLYIYLGIGASPENFLPKPYY